MLLEHGPFIRRALAQLGVAGCDLDDVHQEVRRAIADGLARFDPSLSVHGKAAIRGWIFGICERQAAGFRRAATKRAEVVSCAPEVDQAPCGVPGAEDRMLERERLSLLFELLSALEASCRAVVVAYELEEMEMADVAATLGIPVNTAWNRLRRGRADLHAAWRRKGASGADTSTRRSTARRGSRGEGKLERHVSRGAGAGGVRHRPAWAFLIGSPE